MTAILWDLVEQALGSCRADGCLALATNTSVANLRWAGNTLTTNGLVATNELTVIAVTGRADGASVGVVTRSGVGPDEVPQLVAAAERAAREAVPAEDAAELVQPSLETPGWADPPAETSMRVFAALAPALGEAFGRARAGGRELFGYAEHEVATSYLGSSTGLRLRHDQPTGRFELTARTADGARSAWSGQSTVDFADVDPLAVAQSLDQRLDWAARAIELPPGRYETLLPPSAVADLMLYLYWSAGALDAFEGRSVFSRVGGGTRVGEQLSDLPLSLGSDPARVGLTCAPYLITNSSSRLASVFDNGLPSPAVDWIRDGRLNALVQTRHSARESGLPATPWVDNLVLSGSGGRELPELIAETGRGLLLTCVWYVREVDPRTLLLTGLTRDGVFLVEDGEVVGAVNNFRFNESPVDLLRRVVEVGATAPTLAREFGDYFTRTAMPTLRIPDFNMSSVSRAS